jgi:LPS export ABC transporter protein LptC
MRGNDLRFATALIAAAFLLAASCSFDYSQSELSDKMSEEIPNTILENFQHTIVQDGKPSFRLSARRAEAYDSKKETRLKDVSFVEYDSRTGEAITAGTATSAIFFGDTENAELSGSISFYSKRNESGLEGGYLFWDNEKKTLEGRRDRLITITTDDGSVIKGEGFTADARRRSMNFSGHTTGYFETKDSEEDKGSDSVAGEEPK